MGSNLNLTYGQFRDEMVQNQTKSVNETLNNTGNAILTILDSRIKYAGFVNSLYRKSKTYLSNYRRSYKGKTYLKTLEKSTKKKRNWPSSFKYYNKLVMAYKREVVKRTYTYRSYGYNRKYNSYFSYINKPSYKILMGKYIYKPIYTSYYGGYRSYSRRSRYF